MRRGIRAPAPRWRLLQDRWTSFRSRPLARPTRARLYGVRGRSPDRGLLGARQVSPRDRAEDRRARYWRRRIRRIRRRRRQHAPQRLRLHGACARRRLDRDFLGRPHRAFRRIDLPVRGRGAETTLAAVHDAFRKDRLVRPDGTARRFGDRRRNDDDLPSRGRRLGPERREKVDRQRDLRRHQCHLGPRREVRRREGVRRRQGQSRLLGQEDREQDRAPRRPERADHAQGLPRSGIRSPSEGGQIQGYREGPSHDPRRRRLVRRRLRARRLRARAALRHRATPVRAPDRRLSARSGSSSANARQRHGVRVPHAETLGSCRAKGR